LDETAEEVDECREAEGTETGDFQGTDGFK